MKRKKVRKLSRLELYHKLKLLQPDLKRTALEYIRTKGHDDVAANDYYWYHSKAVYIVDILFPYKKRWRNPQSIVKKIVISDVEMYELIKREEQE